MNVYEKLNLAREKFHAAKIKKTGLNKFAGYEYFELADFITPALQIFKEVGLLGIVSYASDLAMLSIINCEKPDEFIQVTSPMSTAALKGCHEVQNLGAVQTYLRRYLWVAALEIVEHDALDATTGKKGDGPVIPSRPLTEDLALTEDALKYLNDELVPYIKDCVKDGDILAAKDSIKKANLSSDEHIALWNMLDSKVRSALEKE